MGWFLPFRKRKSTARRPAARSARVRSRPAPRTKASGGRWDPNRTLAGLEALAAVVLLFAVLLSWRFSESALKGFVHAQQLPKIGPKQIELAQVPAWMG